MDAFVISKQNILNFPPGIPHSRSPCWRFHNNNRTVEIQPSWRTLCCPGHQGTTSFTMLSDISSHKLTRTIINYYCLLVFIKLAVRFKTVNNWQRPAISDTLLQSTVFPAPGPIQCSNSEGSTFI